MASSRALPPEIQEALARGWTVLTANQRSARSLRRAFDLDQRGQGHAHWQPPSILAWDSWLVGLWRNLILEGHATDLLLNPSQEHTLWRDVITSDPDTSSLRPIDALASSAADAWLLLHTYRGTDRLRRYGGNSDTRVFARWASELGRRCSRAQFLTRAQLPERLREAAAVGQLTIPPGILLVGFDVMTPEQTALLEQLRKAGSFVEQLALSTKATSLRLAEARTGHGELAACARWLRGRLTEQPDARLAVIVPDIEISRAEVDRVFRHVLAPELEDIHAPVNAGPYEFSLGVPLATIPMVTAAFDILRWAIGPLSLERVSALLLSPHFATEATEHLARAEFDAFGLRQRHLLLPQLTLDSLFAFASKSKSRSGLSVLLRHLQDLRPLFNQRDFSIAERTHADWAATIHDMLETAGWARPAKLDSVEFQARRKWESALDELASLDFDNSRVLFAQALESLERICAETLFAPESRQAPVQVMGPLESAGSEFDAIWFLRANDICWPSRPSPNPLLPWQLQRDLAMPGANPALDAARAREITERIASSAAEVVFSYAQESKDGQQRPSPMLSGLALEVRSAEDIAPAELAAKRVEIEVVPDVLPALPPPGYVFRGGAAILQAQAACSFRAFAEKRLFAVPLEPVELGLDARERGSLVHKVLEKFWSAVGTQAALRQMTTADRDAELGRSINAALARDAAKADSGWSASYLETERQRLLNLLRPWLDFEARQRPAFAVHALEETMQNVEIGSLSLDVRIDRIDTALVDSQPAGKIILDYKTSDNTPAKWLGERPDEPQLPLYAVLTGGNNLAAVAFAVVRPGKTMGLNGYQSSDGILPRIKRQKVEDLSFRVEDWKAVLSALAEEFHAGTAQVSPKQYPSTCRNCDQRLLCRLNVASLDAEANEDFADDKPNESLETADGPPAEVVRG